MMQPLVGDGIIFMCVVGHERLLVCGGGGGDVCVYFNYVLTTRMS